MDNRSNVMEEISRRGRLGGKRGRTQSFAQKATKETKGAKIAGLFVLFVAFCSISGKPNDFTGGEPR
jgi:hypothetical protein